MADSEAIITALNQAIKAISVSERNKTKIPSLLAADGSGKLISSVDFHTVWQPRIKRYFANAGIPDMAKFLEACYNTADKKVRTLGENVPQSTQEHFEADQFLGELFLAIEGTPTLSRAIEI